MELFELEHDGTMLRGILTGPDDANHLAICVAGFEGVSSTSKRFRVLCERLEEKGVMTLCLDYAGCGLSGGDFSTSTVEGLARQLAHVVRVIHPTPGRISLVGHSLGACIILAANHMLKFPPHRLLFFSPALDQRGLLRFWYASRLWLPGKSAWSEYPKFLDEKLFLEDGLKPRECKRTLMQPAYFQENVDFDYHNLMNKDLRTRAMIVHGEKDVVVPPESVRLKSVLKHMVPDGDHDLEMPSAIASWLQPALDHLTL